MLLAAFHLIIDLHLNLNMVQNEAFYFPSFIQAPLTTGEVLLESVLTLNLEGRWEPRNITEPSAS